MNRNVLEGKWMQLRGAVREKWGDLTDDDLDQIAGKREKLAGVLQERYGYSEIEANREIDDFLTNWDNNDQLFESLLNICQRGISPLANVENLEKEKARGYHSTYYFGSVIAKCVTRLALQPKLGLRWQWDCWFPFAPGNPWFAV